MKPTSVSHRALLAALLAVPLAAFLVARAADPSDGPGPRVPAGAPSEARDGELTGPADLEDALRRALLDPADREAVGERDFASLLRAARAALEAGRHAELAEQLSVALTDLDGLFAYVGRLGQSEPTIPADEYPDLLFGLRLLLGVRTGLEMEGHGVGLARFHGDLEALLVGVLERLGDLPREVALELLGDLGRADVLGVDSLDRLARWLVPLGYCAPLARLVCDLAVRAEPPRMELLMDLAHHADPAIQLLVAEHLSDLPGAPGLELALDLARTLAPDSPLRMEVDRLICRKAEPAQAFDHLLERASEEGRAELTFAALDLAERDLATLAFERYAEQPEPDLRKLLVLAGRSDAEFLEYVLDTDDDDSVRAGALLNLAIQRPDERTAARLVADLGGLARDPWPEWTGPSLLRAAYAQAALHAAGNLAQGAPARLRSSPPYRRLRTLVAELADRTDLDETSQEIARSVLRSFGP